MESWLVRGTVPTKLSQSVMKTTRLAEESLATNLAQMGLLQVPLSYNLCCPTVTYSNHLAAVQARYYGMASQGIYITSPG